MPVFCSRCGAEYIDGSSYCSQCGSDLRPGQQPGSGSPTSTPVPSHVPNYLAQAILVTIFCCIPFGIVAIAYAAQVNGKLETGDYAGALRTSNSAKTWCWVSLWVGLGTILLGGVCGLAMGAAGL